MAAGIEVGAGAGMARATVSTAVPSSVMEWVVAIVGATFARTVGAGAVQVSAGVCGVTAANQ